MRDIIYHKAGGNHPARGEALIDREALQSLQDAFCQADRLYCVCLDKSANPITEPYGSMEEQDFIKKTVSAEQYRWLHTRIIHNRIENVVEEDTNDVNRKLCAAAVRVHGEIEAVWIVHGFLDDGSDQESSGQILRTTEEQYYKSIHLLETLSKQYITARINESLAQEAYRKSRESEKKVLEEFKRNEVMTKIVRMLESENSFAEIVNEIFEYSCDYLQVTSATLLNRIKDSDELDVISFFKQSPEASFPQPASPPEREECPFFTGKQYMISSDSVIPREFSRFFARYGIRAAVCLPIEVSGETGMYAIFTELERDRSWSVSEIKFLNDVKRIIQSILIRRITKNSLASSYASVEAILENVGCGVCVKDPRTTKSLYTNQCYRDFFHTREEEKLEALLVSARTEQGKNYFEYYLDEARRWFDVYQSMIRWVDGRAVRLFTVYEVTDKKLYQQKIEKQANYDALTGLYNRLKCEKDLEIYIEQTKEIGGQGALLYLDLDEFKNINDNVGHEQGDVLLKSIAERLQQVGRLENNCYRVGGDEFVLIVPNHLYNLLPAILEDIRSVFSKPLFLNGTDHSCTMSMGISVFPHDGSSPKELMRKADMALFEAKRTGKNRIEYFDDRLQNGNHSKTELEKSLRLAAEHECDEFEVFYQPIFKMDGSCAGAEALVRWNSREMGHLAPSEFIPLAEYSGMIHPIGSYVLRKACLACRNWNSLGHPEYKIHVNLSIVQLLQNDIVDQILRIVEETGIVAENLVLEVTEGLAIKDMNRMNRILNRLHQKGIAISLDDFGSGLSSIHYIREMPIDMIKIGRCFTMDLDKDAFSYSFVKMTAELATAMDVMVCVAGVEESQQIEALKGMNVQQMQGFYFDRPMSEDDYLEKYLYVTSA